MLGEPVESEAVIGNACYAQCSLSFVNTGRLTQRGKATNTAAAKGKVTDGWKVDSYNDQSMPNGVSLLCVNGDNLGLFLFKRFFSPQRLR